MISITRRFQWSMGHTLKEHRGPCKNLHGHNYVGYFTFETSTLNSEGMVLDFSAVKELVGSYLDLNLDHRFLVHEGDFRAPFLREIDGRVVTLSFNPTAENLAFYLLEVLGGEVHTSDLPVHLTKVLLYETENCYAEATL